MKKPETRRQRKTRLLLTEQVGGKWYKVWGGPYQQGGIPDLLGCVEGLFFGFEIKEPDGAPSQLQINELEEIAEAGGCSSIIVDPWDAVRLVRKTLSRAKARR